MRKFLVLCAGVLALSACAAPSRDGAAPAGSTPSEPPADRNSIWCGTTPPSGYCASGQLM